MRIAIFAVFAFALGCHQPSSSTTRPPDVISSDAGAPAARTGDAGPSKPWPWAFSPRLPVSPKSGAGAYIYPRAAPGQIAIHYGEQFAVVPNAGPAHPRGLVAVIGAAGLEEAEPVFVAIDIATGEEVSRDFIGGNRHVFVASTEHAIVVAQVAGDAASLRWYELDGKPTQRRRSVRLAGERLSGFAGYQDRLVLFTEALNTTTMRLLDGHGSELASYVRPRPSGTTQGQVGDEGGLAYGPPDGAQGETDWRTITEELRKRDSVPLPDRPSCWGLGRDPSIRHANVGDVWIFATDTPDFEKLSDGLVICRPGDEDKSAKTWGEDPSMWESHP